MGMDIHGSGGYFRWSMRGWFDVLSLAEKYGWQPTRTGPPKGQLRESWDGNYGTNDGQLFYARDAKRLADALEIALKAQRGKQPPKQTAGQRSVWLSSREERRPFREFIKFCRAGSFRIY